MTMDENYSSETKSTRIFLSTNRFDDILDFVGNSGNQCSLKIRTNHTSTDTLFQRRLNQNIYYKYVSVWNDIRRGCVVDKDDINNLFQHTSETTQKSGSTTLFTTNERKLYHMIVTRVTGAGQRGERVVPPTPGLRVSKRPRVLTWCLGRGCLSRYRSLGTRRMLGKRCRMQAFWGKMFSSSGGPGEDAWSSTNQIPVENQTESRREALLDFVNRLSPATHRISDPLVPKMSIVAIRQTVGNLIGTLPAEYFEITISSREENLMQLMYSVLMTGYMFCNAHHRLELAKRLEIASPRGLGRRNNDLYAQDVSLPQGEGTRGFLPDVRRRGESSHDEEEEEESEYEGQDAGVYAAGTQKIGIQGEVLRWHFEHGVQQISASDYIEQLEQEVAALRTELSKRSDTEESTSSDDRQDSTDDALARLAYYTRNQNHLPLRSNEIPKGYQVEQDPTSVLAEELESELLAHLKSLSSEQVAELTECASTDVMESMNALVERLVGKDDDGIWKGGRKSQCTSTELGEILFWLMGVGHQLRDMEIRLSLTNRLQSISSTFGPDDGLDEYGIGDDTPKLPPGR